MDARKHNLLIPLCYQALYLCSHILSAAAAHSSPGIGNDAVAAELIAAILNLDKSPGMAAQLFQMKALILAGMGDIQHVDLLILFL